MAKITYGDELPDDSVGKKFQGAVYDTGSANAIAAVKGVNPVTQQGKTVVDQSVAVSTASGAGAAGGLAADAAVTTDATGTRSAYLRGLVAWLDRLGFVDGDTFTAGSSYGLAGLMGVYQSTVSTLAAGKTGLARLTSRRAVVTAGDYSKIFLDSSTPVPSGSDITNATSGALVAADFNIRDATMHSFVIPLSAANWRDLQIGLYFSGFDQTVSVSLSILPENNAYKFGRALSFTVPAAGMAGIITSAGEVGVGGLTGGATLSDQSIYSVPVIANARAVSLNITASSAPTTGTIWIMIDRRS